MPLIRDRTQAVIAKPELDMRVSSGNIRMLSPSDLLVHFKTLKEMLCRLAQLCGINNDLGTSDEFSGFLLRIDSSLKLMLMKAKIQELSPNRDVNYLTAIDISESGFPVVVRDFYLLQKDKEEAGTFLNKLPGDTELVDNALYTLFKNIYPQDIIVQKLLRNYYQALMELKLPCIFGIYPQLHISAKNNLHYCKQSFERFDENHSIPRFYTLYLSYPSQSYGNEDLQYEIQNVFASGLNAGKDFELNYLAKAIDDINGVQVEMIERIDIGPFYNRFTSNTGNIQILLEDAGQDEAIIFFRKYFVQRVDEVEKKGIKNKVKGIFSGDWFSGIFGPSLASTQYMLMPHRLIQKATQLNLEFKSNIKMYGISKDGGLLD